MLAASPGFEPRLTESESAVLPLDDEAICQTRKCLCHFKLQVNNFFKKNCSYPYNFSLALPPILNYLESSCPESSGSQNRKTVRGCHRPRQQRIGYSPLMLISPTPVGEILAYVREETLKAEIVALLRLVNSPAPFC